MNASETLALLALGRDAWNDWAEEMMAQKASLLRAQGQAEHDSSSEAEKAWAAQARADFTGVHFSEDCNFAGFVFPGRVEFWPLYKKIDGRNSLTPTCFEKRAIFDGAKFLGPAWFLGAIFKDQASFRNAEFAGNANFKDAIFGGDVCFNLAKFDEVLFDQAKFQAGAAFGSAAFSRANSSFGRAAFSGAAIFSDARFSCEYLYFTGAEFASAADFCEVKFTGDIRLDQVKFAEEVHFSRASFNIVTFQKTKFTKAAHFERATFSGYTSFRGAIFKQEANFEGIRSESGFEVELAAFLKLPNFDDASFSRRKRPNPQILAEPKPRKRSKEPRYFEVHVDFYGKLLFWELENVDRLQADGRGLMAPTPWPDGYLQSLRGPWILPEYLERPRFVIDEKKGRLPCDLETYDGVFIISNAMKAVFETLAPNACDIRPCDTVLSSGQPGPELWLCSVTRAFIGAIDFERSALRVSFFANNGQPVYSLAGGPKLLFKPEIIGEAHLFHAAEFGGSTVFCGEAFKQACKEAGLKGICFTSYQ